MVRKIPTVALVRGNPFIPRDAPQQVVEGAEPDPIWNDALSLSGPSSPAAAPHVDVTADEPWPTVGITDRPLVCVVGLHGGSGASLISGFLGADAFDVGRSWPVFTGWDRPKSSLSVVVCARTHYQGIQAAARFARLWAADTLPASTLLGMVLIDDGPKLSQQQRVVVRRVGQMTPNGWHIPWQETWRLAQPSYDATPIRVRRIIQNIRTLAQSTNGDRP